MIEYHGHDDSYLTYTIEWWEGTPFKLTVFYPNDEPLAAPGFVETLKYARFCGDDLCDKMYARFNDDLYNASGELGGEESEE